MALIVFSIALILGSWWLGQLMTRSGFNDDGSTHGQDGFTTSGYDTDSHSFD